MKFHQGQCNTLIVKASQCHVRYVKTLKDQSIQQQYIFIITYNIMACDTHIVRVSHNDQSCYISIRGSTETLICMEPWNWNRMNFVTRSQEKVQILNIL